MKYILLVITILSILSYVFIKCSSPIYKKASRISYTEQASKKRGVYLWSYKPKQVIINDSIQFKIIEGFAEKQFIESQEHLHVKGEDSIQIKLITDSNLVLEGNYNSTWIVNDVSYHGNGFVKKFKGIMPSDTIMFNVFNKEVESRSKIGEFCIERKE